MRAIKTTTVSLLALGLLAGSAVGVAAQDEETGEEFTLQARVVLNATGVFCDQVRQMDEADCEPVVTASQSFNIGEDAANGDRNGCSECCRDQEHVEAIGAKNGIGLVKLMGRESGFIAAQAALANSEVNFCLIPEIRFSLDGLLKALTRRLKLRGHAVIVVGEGAGQDLLETDDSKDASGNKLFGDIGMFLKQSIKEHYAQTGMQITLKYIDPSYTIRSMPASAYDSAFCLQLGHYAVHAGMAGRTNMLVGHWNDRFTHVPIPVAVEGRKKISHEGALWLSVLESTGQPVSLISA